MADVAVQSAQLINPKSPQSGLASLLVAIDSNNGVGAAKDGSAAVSANPFQDLMATIDQLNAGLNAGDKKLDTEKLSADQLAKLASKIGIGGASKSNVADLIKALDSQNTNQAIPPELMAQLNAFMQQYPQFQVLFDGKTDLNNLAAQVNEVELGGTPDYSKYNTSKEVQAALTALKSMPDQVQELQGMLTKLQNADLKQPDGINMPALAKQLNIDPNALPQTLVEQVNKKPDIAEPSVMKLGNAAQAVQQKVVDANASKPENSSVIATNDVKAEVVALVRDLQKQNTTGAETPIAVKGVENIQKALEPQVMAANAQDNLMVQLGNVASEMQKGQVNLMSAGAAQSYSAVQAHLSNATMSSPAMQAAVQIQQSLAHNAQNNSIMIQLYPQEMGQVQVKLSFDRDNRVTAKVSADKQETLDMLKQDSGGLSRALQNAGLQADSNSLEFTLSQNNQNLAREKKDSATEEFGTMLANETSEQNIMPTVGRVQYVTLEPGRVDVKL